MKSDKELRAELKIINQRIRSVEKPVDYHKTKVFIGYFVFLAITFFCVSLLVHYGPEITGFVTFSESVVKAEKGSISVEESGTVMISTDLDNINSVMLSGTVYGNGRAAVFLKGAEKNYLAYYFEGDAGDGVSFSDMCYDTCHIEGLGKDNTLIFELENTRIDIDSIKYVFSRIIDFDLEPRRWEIDYKKDPASIVELKLTNNQQTDYSVLLYVDGPLSNSFSWQGSLIHMTPEEPEKVIPITVKLPSNLPKGEYTQRITARYVPPDTYDFVGESPVAESFITIINR